MCNKSGVDVATFIAESIKMPFIFLTFIYDPCTFVHAKKLNPSVYLFMPICKDY